MISLALAPRFLLGILLACSVFTCGAARNTYFVSDLHLGIGRDAAGKWSPLEDFRWHDAFAAFLDHLSATTRDDAELVILGDMLELWQSSRMRCSTVAGIVSCSVDDCVGTDTGCSEKEVLQRLKRIVKQHDKTLRALGLFARKGANRVVIVPGNHDAALLFPSTAALIKRAIDGPKDRVVVATNGLWQSSDGKVLAEHGHQMDRVNSFDGWPLPFVVKNDKQFLRRPGGESLVQTFYNRYERQFEAVDNFATETEGMSYAIKALGAKGVVVAAHEFAYFLVVRSSLEQRFDWLGSRPQDGDVQWNIEKIRESNDGALVLGSFAASAPERTVLADAHAKGGLQSLLGQLADDDIKTLCDRIEVVVESDPASRQNERCPRMVERNASLGYFAGKLMRRHDQDMNAYLAKVNGGLSAPYQSFKVFIFGHTHSARQPRPVKVTPEWEVTVVNTGAFQRIASSDFIASFPTAERDDPAFLSKLKLERLPECYSFVALDPADGAPRVKLRYWRREVNLKQWNEAEDCRPRTK